MKFKPFIMPSSELKSLEVSSSLELGVNDSRIAIISDINILITSLRESLEIF